VNEMGRLTLTHWVLKGKGFYGLWVKKQIEPTSDKLEAVFGHK